MVDLSGHVAMGLLFALPAWILLSGRRSLGFVALAALAALLPDIDLWLVAVAPDVVHHHGVTHTIFFVTVASAVGAAVVAGAFTRYINGWLEPDELARSQVLSGAFPAFLTGSLSHLFADMLSAPDISTPIEPLWPLAAWTWGVDLVWYNVWWINSGFLAAMVAAHLAAAYATTPAGERHRLRPF